MPDISVLIQNGSDVQCDCDRQDIRAVVLVENSRVPRKPGLGRHTLAAADFSIAEEPHMALVQDFREEFELR